MQILLPAFLFLTAVVLLAQEEDPRKRMIFSGTNAQPEVSPALTSKPQNPEDPGTVIRGFFLALKSGQVQAAYEGLIRNTIIAERQEDVSKLIENTQKALDSYGPVTDYEVIDSLQVGSHLTRQTCISLNKDLPLRWRFYFYRSNGIWKLVDIRVDDGLVELFEEVARRKN